MSFEVKNLSPGFGAEILGFRTYDEIDQKLVSELIDVWRSVGGLLVIRNQKLTTEQHINFSRFFGPLFGDKGNAPLQETVSQYIHPRHPQIYRVSNQTDDKGKPLGRKGAGTYWHSDVSFRDYPAQASLLYGRKVPPVGGDTMFADQARSYEALSSGMKALLDPLYAVHDFEIAARTQYAKPTVIEDDLGGQNRAIHPIVRTHNETKRKSLYINPGFTSYIDGFLPGESEVILNFLYEHSKQPEFVYRHCWNENDLVIWDNRTLMHCAVMDYPDDATRYMERCTVIGEKPV